MKIQEHKDLFYPNNINVKIWKYMDLPKFLYLLEFKKLFFSSISTLSPSDPFEGSIPTMNVEDRENAFLGLADISVDEGYKIIEQFRNSNIKNREAIYINCWSMYEHESIALWEKYVGNQAGVVISTTLKKLSDSINPNEGDIFASEIKYIDYTRDRIPSGNIFYPILYKRKNFDFEKELRLIAWDPLLLRYNNTAIPPKGKGIAVNVEKAINDIIFSPNMPEWQSNLISKICKNYRVDQFIRTSELSIDPKY